MTDRGLWEEKHWGYWEAEGSIYLVRRGMPAGEEETGVRAPLPVQGAAHSPPLTQPERKSCKLIWQTKCSAFPSCMKLNAGPAVER